VTCDPERVTGYVDGTFGAAVRAEVESHLADCPACREQAEFERELRRRLRALPAATAPLALETHVRQRLRRARARRWLALLPLAAGFVVGALGVLGSAPFLAYELARDHGHCFGMDKIPAQIWSADPGRVAAWLQEEGLAGPLLPASAAGLELLGARRCPLLDRQVVHVYYAAENRHLSLFVVPSPVWFGRSYARAVRDTTVRLVTVGGLHCGLVGEQSEDVEAFRRALTTTVAGGHGGLTARPTSD
jgi:anti-sigma factor RsiW